jgi:hypothetical protein
MKDTSSISNWQATGRFPHASIRSARPTCSAKAGVMIRENLDRLRRSRLR